MKFGTAPKKLPVALDELDFIKMMKVTNKKHHKLAFLLGFGSGLRVSEVVNLLPRDVDINERKILIRQGKGSKDRIVPLPKGFRNGFVVYLPIKCGARSLQRAFKRYAKKSGVLENKPNASFHSLRHGFGSRLACQGVPVHHIRTLMGHSNISTTNVYLEMNPKEALKKYEELF